MNRGISIGAALALSLLTGVSLWRWSDHRADKAERLRLLATQPIEPPQFNLSMIANLPEPAQRYFAFTIRPGTPLYTVAQISMAGQFSLGSKDAPDYMQMSAEQTLSSPHGFIWKMQAARGVMRLSGSDSGQWTRFWIMGLVPVAHIGASSDHSRSAFGRYVAEAVFWTPAALLPGQGIAWEPVNESTARVIITNQGLSQPVDVTVDDEGKPIVVKFPRWSDANPDKVHRIQPFGGYLSGFKTFAGFTLPTHVEAGNYFETEDYFPFYIADISDIRFPVSEK